MMNLLKTVGVALSATFLACATGAQAQWPEDKPITIIHPFSAGSDALMRLVAAGLQEKLGQTVIFDNRPGAGGAIGTAYAARQKPDGYTLASAYPGPTANFMNTRDNLPYNPQKDFVYISRISYGNMVLAVRKDFPANNLKELIEYIKANPGKVSAGNNGIGSYGHMIALAFRDMQGLDYKTVPYNGSNVIITDMLSGSLDMTIDYLGDVYMKQLQAGTIKPIAIASEARSPLLPNTPTFKESGVDIVSAPWGGIMAPAGTPDEIIQKISAALKTYLAEPDTIKKFAAIGQVSAWTTPQQFHDMVINEEEFWRPIIKKYNIK